MKIVFFGDSITVGTYTAVGEESPQRIAKPNYAEIIKEFFGCEIENLALNGTPFSSTSSVNPQYAICKRINEVSYADIIFVAGGTNDYGTSVELGDEKDSTDVSFYGAVNLSFNLLKNKAKKIFVITPIPRLDDGKNEKGYTLLDYRGVLAVLTKKYGYKLINGENLPINPKNEDDKYKYIFDGVHLSPEGHKVYADYVINKIKGEV